MDEKRASAPRTSRSPSFLRRHNSRSRRLIPFAMLIALTFLYLTQMFPSRERSKSWLPESRSPINEGTARTINSSKIPLEAHIMSKCPDARDCLRDMVVPTMVEVADLVDFKLSFIGEIDNSDSTVHCKHGPTECLGNQLALCATYLYPNNTKISLGFANCLIADYKEIPNRSLVESCALEHAVDFGRLNSCISDTGHGEDLLRDSVQRSKDAGVVFSCTVRLSDQTWCIRDGGRWKNCKGGSNPQDLIDEVKQQYKKLV